MADKTYTIILNGETCEVGEEELTVRQIRALFGVDGELDMILQGKGEEEDRVLGADDAIRLGDRPTILYLRPMTMFGSAAA